MVVVVDPAGQRVQSRRSTSSLYKPMPHAALKPGKSLFFFTQTFLSKIEKRTLKKTNESNMLRTVATWDWVTPTSVSITLRSNTTGHTVALEAGELYPASVGQT